MTINWEVVAWTCITIGVLLALVMGIYYFFSAKALKERRKNVLDINNALKPGTKVMFAGILGTITKVHDDFLDVEIAKNTVVTVSRYAVTNVMEK